MTLQLDIFESRLRRDEGIARAVDHANRVDPDWSEKAYKFLLQFIENHNGAFMAEDVRSHAALMDFPLPPNNRAWGGIIVRAKVAGLIASAGTRKVKNKKAHCANAAVWIKV